MLVVEQSDEKTILSPAPRGPTVREAMSHTSGLPFFSKYEKTIDLFPLREAVLAYGLTPLNFEPGTKYAYGNIGINTCGRIIETLTGETFDQVLRSNFFEPLGMRETSFVPTEKQIARLAATHKPIDPTKPKPPAERSNDAFEIIPTSQLKYPLTDASRHPAPSGGLFSTAADVATFGQLILNGGKHNGRSLLSGEPVRRMTSTQTGTLLSKDGNQHGDGLGWTTNKVDGLYFNGGSRYVDGLMPVNRRNCLLKCCGSGMPTRAATLAIGSAV